MIAQARPGAPRVLLVDLNNFSRFPTLPVGSIAAVLRKAGHAVEVLSPLAVGVAGFPRPARANPWGYWDERLRWWSATTPAASVRALRRALRSIRGPERASLGKQLMRAVQAALDRRPDVVLVSTYLMYRSTVRRLAAMADERGIPLIVGGPAFHAEETRRAWLELPGLTGIFAGEAEPGIVELVGALADRRALDLPGLTRPGRPDGGLAPPLANLDALPFPDYRDFPWERYPNRIVSMLTARGCGWGVCRFCSDVVTVAGRGFRTRSLGNVLAELAFHRERHRTSLFCFSDLKLNSDVALWRGLHEGLQSAVPDAKWACAVHCGPRADEGLSAADLRAARRAGLVRITTGLETGSPRLLERMRKGTHPDRLRDFLAAAHGAGISTRVTAFTGYPGEDASDIEATTLFLDRANGHLERVHLSRLLLQSGTPLRDDLAAGRLDADGIRLVAEDPEHAQVSHVSRRVTEPGYRKAVARLLRTVHAINRRPLRFEARELEGAM